MFLHVFVAYDAANVGAGDFSGVVESFIHRLTVFKSRGLNPVPIFDGDRDTLAKLGTNRKRTTRSQKEIERACMLRRWRRATTRDAKDIGFLEGPSFSSFSL